MHCHYTHHTRYDFDQPVFLDPHNIRLLPRGDAGQRVTALCVDIDSEALRHTNQHVNIFPHRASVRLMSENVIKWAIGRVRHHIEPQDIIYSSGLCDYLDPRLFRALICRCHEHLWLLPKSR